MKKRLVELNANNDLLSLETVLKSYIMYTKDDKLDSIIYVEQEGSTSKPRYCKNNSIQEHSSSSERETFTKQIQVFI